MYTEDLMTDAIELGLDTFGDITLDADRTTALARTSSCATSSHRPCWPIRSGWRSSASASTIGRDFAVSAPEVVLAAIAGQTSQHSSRLVGDGAELGRSRSRLRAVFDTQRAVERARRGDRRPRLVHRIVPAVRIRSGAIRSAVRGAARALRRAAEGTAGDLVGPHAHRASRTAVYPPIEPGSRLRVWVGVGGTPQSVVRAAHYGLPLMLAIIGGSPRRFTPYVDLFHRALAEFGHETLPIGAHSPGHVAATDEQAREELWPHHKAMMTRIGAERGWPPVTRAAVRTRGRPGRRAVRRFSRDRRRQDRRDDSGAVA